MVGVPTFLNMWPIGPSSLIGPVILWDSINLINGTPTTNTIIIEDIVESHVLKVK